MKPPCKGHNASDQCLAKGCFYHHTHLPVRDMNLNLATLQRSGHQPFSSRSMACFLQWKLREREKDL